MLGEAVDESDAIQRSRDLADNPGTIARTVVHEFGTIAGLSASFWNLGGS